MDANRRIFDFQIAVNARGTACAGVGRAAKIFTQGKAQVTREIVTQVKVTILKVSRVKATQEARYFVSKYLLFIKLILMPIF